MIDHEGNLFYEILGISKYFCHELGLVIFCNDKCHMQRGKKKH